jgi:serine/threonine-protein kinase RsbT
MEYRVSINSEPDATRAIMQVRRSAAAAGFDATRVSLLGTVASELVRNILKYAGSGELTVRQVDSDGREGLELVATDQGPGIADVEAALRDHVSTGGTLGLGLPGVKRMMDEFHIRTSPGGGGGGTSVTVRKWLK